MSFGMFVLRLHMLALRGYWSVVLRDCFFKGVWGVWHLNWVLNWASCMHSSQCSPCLSYPESHLDTAQLDALIYAYIFLYVEGKIADFLCVIKILLLFLDFSLCTELIDPSQMHGRGVSLVLMIYKCEYCSLS